MGKAKLTKSDLAKPIKQATNIPETNNNHIAFNDHTSFNVEESDLEDNNSDFNKLLEELDTKNNKYKSNEFLLKLSNTCNEFHYQILSHIQLQLNNTTITENDYILAYKVAKETGAGTQIIDEKDFKSFIEDYNQATNKKKDVKKPKESQLDDDKRHIKLSGMHYTTWARAIINGLADIDTPP
ncbi:9337_t:CDS:2, partial [Dentiscutata heterogama]